MNTPILLLVFNRPDFVEKLIKRISIVQPKKLYIAFDGPRNEIDQQKINEITILFQNIQWESDLKFLYRETNLKTYKAIPSAINWFFSNEEEGIILEDDCLPDASFFSYCEILLEKYRNDDNILSISGNNLENKSYGDGSYFLCKIPHIWGWATWKKSWEKFDINMKMYPQFKSSNKIKECINTVPSQKRFTRLFDLAYKDKNNIWDFKWTFAHFYFENYSIIPNKNLVTNIGFDLRATNLLSEDNFLSNLPLEEITNIKHPENLKSYYEYDIFLETTIFKPHDLRSILIKLLLYLKKWKAKY